VTSWPATATGSSTWLVGEPVAGGRIAHRGVEHRLVAAHQRVVLLEHEPLAAGGDGVLHHGAQAGRAGLLLAADAGGVVQVDDDAELEDGRQDLPAAVVALLGEVPPGLPGKTQLPQGGPDRREVARLDHCGGDEQRVPLALVDEGVRAHPAVAGAAAGAVAVAGAHSRDPRFDGWFCTAVLTRA
jgi:hypothetical protein